MKDVNELRALVVRIGGRGVDDGWDRVARYCGLDWSGGSDETWAFRYYDSISSPSDSTIEPVDVMATAALHPSLTKADLTFFFEERTALERWLADLPTDEDLAAIDADVHRHLDGLSSWAGSVSLQLLTKVLHKKRPLQIPLVDRHVLDWYRPVTGERSAVKAWPALLRAVGEDLDVANAGAIRAMADAVEDQTLERLSPLRVMDIIIWMGAHR